MELIFSLDEIDKAAAKFLAATAGHKVFAFHAEMGTGKTTFIHALCAAMGIKDNVSSPTFSMISQYKTGKGETLYHMDLYRIKDENEAIHAGVEDALYSGHFCLVEWPEKAPGIFPNDTLNITISIAGANTRKLEINL